MPRFVVATLSLALGASVAAQNVPPANGRNAVVSPDGRRVLYVSELGAGPGLYVVNTDGSGNVRIGASIAGTSRGVWSMDGQRLLFARVASDTIRVISMMVDNAKLTELGAFPAPGARAATVSPDGSRIVYGAGPWPAMQLHSATLGGTAPTQITPGGRDAFWCHAVSRDGQRVAVGRADSTRAIQIWVMGIDGSGARQVTHFPKADGSPQCPMWSADGKMIAVQSSVPALQDTTQHIGSIWVVDVASGAATKLGEHSAPYVDELPAWFPDGKRLAFHSDRTGRWEIWVINVDGSAARQLTR